MRVTHPVFVILAVIALPVLLGWSRWVYRKVQRGNAHFHTMDSRIPILRDVLPFWLPAMCWLVALIGLAGLQVGEETTPAFFDGHDVYFVFDISWSMRAADTPPSRIENAKMIALSLLDRLKNAPAGIVSFHHQAFPVCPLTSDRSLLRQAILSLQPQRTEAPGTDLNGPFTTLARMLKRRDPKHLVSVILISDGESFTEISSSTRQWIEQNAIRVITVGVGKTEGAVLEKPDLSDFIRQPDGTVAKTVLNDKNLKILADIAGGSYFSQDTPGVVAQEIARRMFLNHSRETVFQLRKPKPRTWEVAVVAYLLLISTVVVMIAQRFRPRCFKTDRFNATGAVVAVIGVFLILPFGGCRQPGWHAEISEGDRYARQKAFAMAQRHYAVAWQSMSGEDPNFSRIGLNLGACLQMTQQGMASLTVLQQTLNLNRDPQRTVDLYYNLGCSAMQMGDRSLALSAFRRCLEQCPSHPDACWNLAMLLQQTPPPPPPPPGGEPPPPPQDNTEQLLDALREQDQMPKPPPPTPKAAPSSFYW